MDNNNQQNLNNPLQSPANPISPPPKKLNNKIIAIIVFVVALIAIVVGFLIFKKYTLVATNTSNNNVPLPSVNSGYDKTSLSWSYVYGPENGRVKVYLYAPDQSSTINQNPWGFAFEGDTIIRGHYKLIMDPSTEEDGLGGGWSSAQVDLGELQFNPTRPLTNGKLHSIQLDQNGYEDAVTFYQYGSSNTDAIYIYRYISNKFSQVHFVEKNGKTENFTETGLGGELQSNPDGTFTSEWYDNTKGYVTTKWKYNYTDNNFHEITTKISVSPPTSIANSSNWKTYRNNDFGFTFSYRFKNKDDYANFAEPTVITTSSTDPIHYDPVAESWWNIYIYPDPTKFHAYPYNWNEDSNGIDLSYSPSTQQWIITTNTTKNNQFCPEERIIGSQSIPYYEVATGHHAGASIQLFITKKGLIVFTGGPVGSFHWYTEENNIVFDDPNSVLKATCTYAGH